MKIAEDSYKPPPQTKSRSSCLNLILFMLNINNDMPR